MDKGYRRLNILDLCPEEFEDQLKTFIDEIDEEVIAIVGELSIESITDIGNIEGAYNLAGDLAESLY